MSDLLVFAALMLTPILLGYGISVVVIAFAHGIRVVDASREVLTGSRDGSSRDGSRTDLSPYL